MRWYSAAASQVPGSISQATPCVPADHLGSVRCRLVYAPDDEPGLIPDVTTAAGLLTFAVVLITVT